MKISVIVPTYNRCYLLKICLSALLRQTIAHNEYEIIVVDDCSSDDTKKYMEEEINNAANLVYIRHNINQGRVVSRNDGIKRAKGEIVIFLDNDMATTPIFVESHIRYHDNAGEKHIAVMGNVSYAPEVINNSNFGRYMQSRYLGCRLRSERSKIDYDNLPGQYFGAGNASVRKEDLIEVGLFDKSFWYYGGEDEHMGYSLKRIGVRIVFCEEAKSIHYDNVSIPRFKMKFMEGGREALPIMLRKVPDYRYLTKIGWLLPIEFKDDSILLIFKKLAILSLVNSITLKRIEIYALATDKYPLAYCSFVYRLLTAGWVRQGFRSIKRGFGQINY